MRQSDILHKDFKPMPYWWEAYKPVAGELIDVPRKARVAIVGGGYAGLSCAIELADSGIETCVLEAAELGSGASTRSGGGVSGGVNIGKSFTGKVHTRDPEIVKVILASGHDAFSLIETMIEREKIDCYWQRLHGRCHAGAQAPPDPARQRHHRHGGAAARPCAHADPKGPHARRHQARALLLPHVAGQQAHDLRRPHALHACDTGRQCADPASLHDGPVSSVEGYPRHNTPGPATLPSPGMLYRIPASWAACITP
jgi:choline dehydrogenase-like flavoprotein